MKSEWKECTIADLGTIITGKTPTTKNKLFWGGKIPFVTPKDIQIEKHIFSTERYVTDLGLYEVKGSILPKGAVCVSCIGNIGYVGITTQKCVSNQQINSIIVNENNDINFVFYLMKSLWRYFKNYEGQSTALSILNKTQFSQIRVPYFDLEVQCKIASILSSIDNKIELNNRMNENLEQQAQAIFKSWFVDFEPFGGVMPDDWKMGTLSDICGYSKDKVHVAELTLDTYFSTENMQPNRQGALQATTLPTIKQTTACKKGDTLISNIRPYFKKILYCHSDCGCSTDVLCFVPNVIALSSFLFCTLYSDKFFGYMVAGSKGTKMPRGDKQQIMMYPICIPSTEYIEKFSSVVAPMLENIYANRLESHEIAIIRDTLLPKLMNGEIDVSTLDL